MVCGWRGVVELMSMIEYGSFEWTQYASSEWLQSSVCHNLMLPLARSYSTSPIEKTFWPSTPITPLPKSATRNWTLGKGMPASVKVLTSVSETDVLPPTPWIEAPNGAGVTV